MCAMGVRGLVFDHECGFADLGDVVREEGPEGDVPFL